MDFLAAEIARKRKEIATAAGDASSPNKKFIRQKDIAAERERRYQEEQERVKAEREAKAAAKLEEARQREAAAHAREAKLRKEKGDKLAQDRIEKTLIDEEVIQRLRELGEPIKLFAETSEERQRRLEEAELKAAVERKRQARLEAAKTDDSPEFEALQNLKPDAEELQIKLSDIKSNPNRLYEQLYRYFKVICQEWTKSMDERDPEVKKSPEGIEALKLHQQCVEDFRPLFRALKRKVPPLLKCD